VGFRIDGRDICPERGGGQFEKHPRHPRRQGPERQEAGIIGYSYEFANVEALNNALVATEGSMDMDKLMGGGEEGGSMETMSENRFEMKKKKLVRVFTMEAGADDDEEGDSEEEQYKQMAEMMFANHFYTINYQFDRQVKKVKKNDYTTSGSNSVEVKVPMTDLMKGDAKLGSQIKLK
jgi:hypothetical protein